MLRRAAAALLLLGALGGCADDEKIVSWADCAPSTTFEGRGYSPIERRWRGLEKDPGRKVRAEDTCPEKQTFEAHGIAGVPLDVAFAVNDPTSEIYLAEGSFLTQRTHPLRAAFFATERLPDHRRGQRCRQRRARTGPVTYLNLFGLAIGLDAPRASTVRIDARTRFRGLGKPLARAREGQRVTVELVKCPDSNKPVATLIRRAG